MKPWFKINDEWTDSPPTKAVALSAERVVNAEDAEDAQIQSDLAEQGMVFALDKVFSKESVEKMKFPQKDDVAYTAEVTVRYNYGGQAAFSAPVTKPDAPKAKAKKKASQKAR